MRRSTALFLAGPLAAATLAAAQPPAAPPTPPNAPGATSAQPSTPAQPATPPAKPDDKAKTPPAATTPPSTPAPATPPASPAKAPAATPPPAPGSTNPPAAPDPGVDQIIKDLESAGHTRDPMTPGRPGVMQPASKTMAPAGSRTLRKEGTFLASRRGRMIRSASGEWVYAFDTDSEGVTDPPMILMPCMNLMGMEKLAERGGEALTFTVSGQIFVYHGRNYLLPTMYMVNHRTELAPGQ